MPKLTSKRAREIGAIGNKNRWANIGPRKRSKMMKELRAKGKQKKV